MLQLLIRIIPKIIFQQNVQLGLKIITDTDGEEILTEGIVRVKRPDAKELLAIRNGEWSYEQLLDFAEGKDKLIRETLYKTSHLPKTVDQKLAAKVLMEVQDLCWNKQFN